MADLIVIGDDGLTASISTYGAELMSLRDAEAREWMWQGDLNIWDR